MCHTEISSRDSRAPGRGPLYPTNETEEAAIAKIAVINDDAAAYIELISQVLREAGHEAVTGFKRDGAFSLVKQARPDLVLLDVMLGDGDADLNLLTMLRLVNETRPIPVIICTACSPSEIDPVLSAATLPDVTIMYKPFDLDHLLRSVNGSLGSHDGHFAQGLPHDG